MTDEYNVRLPDVLPVDTIWCSEAYWCSDTITSIILESKAHVTEGTILSFVIRRSKEELLHQY